MFHVRIIRFFSHTRAGYRRAQSISPVIPIVTISNSRGSVIVRRIRSVVSAVGWIIGSLHVGLVIVGVPRVRVVAQRPRPCVVAVEVRSIGNLNVGSPAVHNLSIRGFCSGGHNRQCDTERRQKQNSIKHSKAPAKSIRDGNVIDLLFITRSGRLRYGAAMSVPN